MTRPNPAEKRLYPRIDYSLPIKVAANGYDFATSTQNVSCLGAYCSINKYVPPFTRVMIKLTLPIKSDAINKSYSVECNGVVVRSEDAENGAFNIAIFFNQINLGQRKKISRYISQFLPERPATTKRF